MWFLAHSSITSNKLFSWFYLFLFKMWYFMSGRGIVGVVWLTSQGREKWETPVSNPPPPFTHAHTRTHTHAHTRARTRNRAISLIWASLRYEVVSRSGYFFMTESVIRFTPYNTEFSPNCKIEELRSMNIAYILNVKSQMVSIKMLSSRVVFLQQKGLSKINLWPFQIFFSPSPYRKMRTIQ